LFAKLPQSIFNRWRFRHILSRFIKFIYGYTGYFELYSVPFSVLPYFDYLEKRDYFVPGGILKTDTIFDWCVENKVSYFCSNWRKNETVILQNNRFEISQGNIQFSYLYLPNLDSVMHKYGPKHPEVEKKIRWLEQQVLQVWEQAERVYDDVSLYVISDHGMAPVTGSIDLISKVEATGLQYGKDYISFYDSTMARFWFKNRIAEEKISNLLNSIGEGKIVSEEELRGMHVYFEDHRFGEMIFLMDEGILINPSFMGLQTIPGMHGYHPDKQHSYAMIAGHHKIPDNIESITDIRKIMEKELKYGK
jgi:predicted AlkP superfamily pyrophosphatase or phosphodiesterase